MRKAILIAAATLSAAGAFGQPVEGIPDLIMCQHGYAGATC